MNSNTFPVCTATLALPRLHALMHAALSLTNQDLWKCSLPSPLSAAHAALYCFPVFFSMSQYMQIYAFNRFISSSQHLPFTFYRFRGAGNVSTPITITTTPSHHHPLVPKGLSTQINWKKEECTVVLPLHLSGRESRRGRTHGPCRGTISLHLSRTVSSLMGWNIARKYIYFYISSVRISLLSPKPSTNSQKYTQWLLVSDYSPPTRRALSNHLANYAFKSNCIKKKTQQKL